ncbi:PhnO protein [Pedobacter westerhofensis]|uniref:PhnO protein n=2 Tax=Pedobacter westerhofensis TaxID=425512 RepID=A0A521DH61_9SPHI|nr:PhnO protein [Pedobacter westerhofensis]
MSDLPAIYRFICELEDEVLDYKQFQQIFEENLHNPNWLYVLAEDETEGIGFISLHTHKLLHHNGLVAEIQEFYTSKKSRGKGVGRLLMNYVINSAQSQNVKSIEVTSNKKRAENIKVYESLGFKLTHNKFTL